MGIIRFIAPSRERLPPGVEDRVYMTSMDGTPWESRSGWDGDQLWLERPLKESGNLHVPWLTASGREIMLSTTTLREQDEPYLLELELIRGLLNRLRNQVYAWQYSLAEAEQAVQVPWQQAIGSFVAAATSYLQNPQQAAELAVAAIEWALEAQHAIVTGYARNSLDVRRQDSRRLGTLFACQIDEKSTHVKQSGEFLATFNAATISCPWKQVEVNDGQFDFSTVETQVKWCEENRLRVCMGPLLCFDQENLPDWLYLWDDDFDALVGYVTNYIGKAIARFKGHVHVREVISRVNLPGALDLNEEQQLQLAVVAIQTARKGDPQVPLVVGFCLPWAEYLAHGKWEISPLNIADALLRAEIGVSGFTLEINLGYQALGSGCRGLLDLSQLIDRWSFLGAPLLIRLVAPSEAGEKVVSGFQASAERQLQTVEETIRLLLCKPAVHGIVYQQWNDLPHSTFPEGGLVTEAGEAKAVLQALTKIRQENLH